MAHWLYPANVRYYDVIGAFKESETYWPLHSKVSIGDVIYIYLAAPYKQVVFVSEVLDVEIQESHVIDKIRPFFRDEIKPSSGSKPFMKLQATATLAIASHSPLSYHFLKENGLNGMLMGPRKLENNPELLGYIKEQIK